MKQFIKNNEVSFRSLVDVERKKKELGMSNKRLQNESTKLKRELTEVKNENSVLK